MLLVSSRIIIHHHQHNHPQSHSHHVYLSCLSFLADLSRDIDLVLALAFTFLFLCLFYSVSVSTTSNNTILLHLSPTIQRCHPSPPVPGLSLYTIVYSLCIYNRCFLFSRFVSYRMLSSTTPCYQLLVPFRGLLISFPYLCPSVSCCFTIYCFAATRFYMVSKKLSHLSM